MKLKDHLINGLTMLQVTRDNKRYACRIVDGNSRVAKYYGGTKPIFIDFVKMIWIKASRRWIVGGGYHPIIPNVIDRRFKEFSSLDDALGWLKTNFKILHPKHRKRSHFIRKIHSAA